MKMLLRAISPIGEKDRKDVKIIKLTQYFWFKLKI